jgi:tRNA threonylcarbamoyladenosine biosynthesis protein TsaE
VHSIQLDLPDLAATTALGQRLGSALFPGAIIALVGPLGAGKTYLVRAIAEGLGLSDSRVVNSPTFGLIHEYSGRLPIYHFDVYRLRTPAEFLELGVEEYFAGDGVCLIEWADKVADYLPAEHLRIELSVIDETSRRARIEANGKQYREFVHRLIPWPGTKESRSPEK